VRIPNIKAARKAAALAVNPNTVTVACKACRTPLWTIEIKGTYGTKTIADKTPFPGIPEWSEYWEKDGRTPKKMSCPVCGDNFYDAIKAEGHIFPRLFVLEHEGA
jgi:hypothetical protein